MLAEENSKELLKNFSQGAKQLMMNAMSRRVATNEGKFQSKEQLEEAGAELAEEMVEASLSKKVTEQ